jgi:cysteine-rich repeat protein
VFHCLPQFECGFECLEEYDIDTGTYYSDCNSECGDGNLAADEECDTGLKIADSSFGCTSACRFTAGYRCEEISCGSGVQQECDTVCGDEIVKGGEECDLGYLNSEGGICLADCKANREAGCIGRGCNISEAALQEYLEKPVELESMGVLSQLNSSREGTSSTRSDPPSWDLGV